MNTILLALALSAAAPSPPVQTAKETVIVVKAPKKMVCGAPRGLATDYAQTVRVCEFK